MNCAPNYCNRLLSGQWIALAGKVLLLTVLLFDGFFAKAQQEVQPEEISVMLNVPRVGATEVSAFVKGYTLYLSVTEVFDFLKIKNRLSPDADSIDGFFIHPDHKYSISSENNLIAFGDRINPIQKGDLLRTATGLYLPCPYFSVFGLECAFDFRSLSVSLQSKTELPVMREMQQELTRRNINQLKGERKADTTIGRQFPLFRLGMADWNVFYSRTGSGPQELRMNVSLGGVVAGGEATLNLNQVAGRPFESSMQFYRWRHVNNDRGWLRQATAGKIFAQSTATLIAPVTGIQINNTPTTYRRSFGTYILSNKTEPGWTVELYVNNILINYTKADASGFFTFEVPMVYGATNVKLRFFGPWGEEQIREESISIPANFLPEKQFEYNVTAGVVSDSAKNRFARASLKYGLNDIVTVGGGVEYFTGVAQRPAMPYVNASMRLLSKIILYAEHTYGVRSKGVLTYRHPSNLQLDLNYISYEKGQTAVKFTEEKRAVLSMPIRTKKFTGFSRLTLSQFNINKADPGTSAEFLFSSFFGGISSNFTTLAVLTDPGNPLIWSNLSMTFRLPLRMRYTHQLQYEYKKSGFSMFRSELEKTVFKNGYLNLVYEKNMLARTSSIGLGLRFNLSFAQTAAFAVKSGNTVSYVQNARGSFLYDDNNHVLRASGQSFIGRAGLTIIPFLDINDNGVRDENEPKVCGMKLKVSGGRISHCSKDTSIQVTGLEPFANCLVEMERNSFDNVAWQLKHATINVVTEPNYFKLIEVPVSIVGEVSGKVLMKAGNSKSGQGRIIVSLFKNGRQVARMITEADGYFSYMGLTPGNYEAVVDASQLVNLNMKATPGKIPFTIKANDEGDFVEGLEFILQKME